MAAPSSTRSLVSLTKRLKISPQVCPHISPSTPQRRHQSTESLPSDTAAELAKIRLPLAVQATYLTPLRHPVTTPQGGTPVCDLQLRSYSVRNLEAFTDFALRAAYYLKLPARGPVPLPRIVERWTVPRSNFVHKKSQENFERRTVRRLIQIRDADVEVVGVWLAFLKRHQYYGVGLKANVFEQGGLETSVDMEKEAERLDGVLGEKLELFGGRAKAMEKEGEVQELVHGEAFKAQWGAFGAMTANQSAPSAKTRILGQQVGEDWKKAYAEKRGS